jgi:hypothetical protein
MRFRMVILAACGLGACSSGGGTGARDGSEGEAVLADSAAGDSYQEVTLGADPAALALVEEYLRRDARGEFIGASEWLNEHLYAGGYGWDGMSIVTGYEIVTAETRWDTTRVTVHWDVIGGCCNHPPPEYKGEPYLIESTDSVAVWTFTVVNMEGGPRLYGDLIHAHMSGHAVLERSYGNEEFRRALEELLRRKGG